MSLDREKAREVLTSGIAADDDWDDLLDALAACVTDEPPTIDREKAREVRGEVLDAMSWAESFSGGRIGHEGAERLLSEYEALVGHVTDGPPIIDCDALIDMLSTALGQHRLDSSVAVGALADRVIALLRPAPAQTIDRDALYSVLDELVQAAHLHGRSPVFAAPNLTDATDRVLALLRPAPAQTISRDAVAAGLTAWLEDDYPFEVGDTSMLIDEASVRKGADRILALLRPDPRIAKLEALCMQGDERGHASGTNIREVYVDDLRAILRGES